MHAENHEIANFFFDVSLKIGYVDFLFHAVKVSLFLSYFCPMKRQIDLDNHSTLD